MIKFRSYTHSVMINYFNNIILILLCTLSAYAINEICGDVTYVVGVIFMLYFTFNSWYKILNPVNWHRNCWYNGGK